MTFHELKNEYFKSLKDYFETNFKIERSNPVTTLLTCITLHYNLSFKENTNFIL